MLPADQFPPLGGSSPPKDPPADEVAEQDEAPVDEGPQMIPTAVGEQELPEGQTVRDTDEDAKQAEKESLGLRRLEDGARVRVTKKQVIEVNGEKFQVQGRVGAIIQTNFASFEDELKASVGRQEFNDFAKVESYVVRTRDAEVLLVTAAPDELELAGHGGPGLRQD